VRIVSDLDIRAPMIVGTAVAINSCENKSSLIAWSKDVWLLEHLVVEEVQTEEVQTAVIWVGD